MEGCTRGQYRLGPVKPTETLARERTPEGDELVLSRRDGVYSLRIGGSMVALPG